jgi:hypothetical protein
LRLCPAYPGNPRRNIEGESPHFVEGTYSLTDLVRLERSEDKLIACGRLVLE